MSYTVTISHNMNSVGATPMIAHTVAIRSVNGRFNESAIPPIMGIGDNVNKVSAFMAYLVPNGKEIHGVFTTDAFGIFTGHVSIDFSVGGISVTLDGVDIASIISPLPPDIAALGLPNADNAWLATL